MMVNHFVPTPCNWCLQSVRILRSCNLETHLSPQFFIVYFPPFTISLHGLVKWYNVTALLFTKQLSFVSSHHRLPHPLPVWQVEIDVKHLSSKYWHPLQIWAMWLFNRPQLSSVSGQLRFFQNSPTLFSYFDRKTLWFFFCSSSVHHEHFP